MAGTRKSASAEADPDAVPYEGRHPKAAATDKARLKNRSGVRADIRKAQRLDEGEKLRQESRAELDKIAAESAKVREKKLAKA